MNNSTALGWDIGGANVKAALAVGSSVHVLARPHPMWERPGELKGLLSGMADELGPADVIGITMTAELADCFRTKAEGVGFVLDALESTFPDRLLRVFTADAGFCSVPEARRTPLAVASANWAASANLLAREGYEALLIDVGTTTTDIIPIVQGRVAACGRTDPERLTNGELVYTGAVRTPVCAIAPWVPLRGRCCRVAAEFFAQAADIHLWLGNLSEGDYVGRAPDGRGTSRAESGARLARSICSDSTLLTEAEITAIAKHLAKLQVRAISAAIAQVRARLGATAPKTVLGAGLGAFLACAAARRTGLAHHALADRLGEAASRAMPAVAVARLLQDASG